MDQDFETYDGIVVPAAARRRERRKARYGTLKDLPEEELADPEELERMMYKEMWGPILALPRQRYERAIRPHIENGRVDWGAFGTVDFDSYRQDFDRLRYKAERLKDKQRDLVIMFDIVRERIPGTAKYKVLKYVRQGILDADDIENWDVWQLTSAVPALPTGLDASPSRRSSTSPAIQALPQPGGSTWRCWRPIARWLGRSSPNS